MQFRLRQLISGHKNKPGRHQDENDARVVRVELTETGDRLVTELTKAHLAQLHKLAAALSKLAPAEQRQDHGNLAEGSANSARRC